MLKNILRAVYVVNLLGSLIAAVLVTSQLTALLLFAYVILTYKVVNWIAPWYDIRFAC